jgi:hypothetical protein
MVRGRRWKLRWSGQLTVDKSSHHGLCQPLLARGNAVQGGHQHIQFGTRQSATRLIDCFDNRVEPGSVAPQRGCMTSLRGAFPWQARMRRHFDQGNTGQPQILNTPP